MYEASYVCRTKLDSVWSETGDFYKMNSSIDSNLFYYLTPRRYKIVTPISPEIHMIKDCIVYVLYRILTDTLYNQFNNQKKLEFAWKTQNEPQPICENDKT